MSEGNLVYGKAGRFGFPVIEFDGFSFNLGYTHTIIPFLEMAYRARRGDVVATELLTKFRVHITDTNGCMYWPPKLDEGGVENG